MDQFGPTLRRLRTQRGMSLRQLSVQVNYDFGYLGQLERGSRPPTSAVAAACDRALGADGTLISAYDSTTAEIEMQRRTVLRALGVLAAGATAPLVSLEALRQGLGQALDADHDEWQQVAADYGLAFYTTPADVLIEQVAADLHVLREMISADHGLHRADLARAASRLSVVLAMALVATGQLHMARRFWRSAHHAAEQSRDVDTRVLVTAWDAVNGCYDGRRPAAVAALTDAGVALAGATATAATAGLYAARAQALAIDGRAEDAVDALTNLADISERLPGPVASDDESLSGWPEHRLRHTESYVNTHLGDVAAAYAAQDRALTLYPDSHARLRTQVQLHRATCLIREGNVGDGLRYAADLLDQLPGEQHNQLLQEVARQVIAAVPAVERRRVEAAALADRLPAVGRP